MLQQQSANYIAHERRAIEHRRTQNNENYTRTIHNVQTSELNAFDVTICKNKKTQDYTLVQLKYRTNVGELVLVSFSQFQTTVQIKANETSYI